MADRPVNEFVVELESRVGPMRIKAHDYTTSPGFVTFRRIVKEVGAPNLASFAAKDVLRVVEAGQWTGEGKLERAYADFEREYRTVYHAEPERLNRRLLAVRQFCAFLLHGTPPTQGTAEWPPSDPGV